jgi:hypothetical protein
MLFEALFANIRCADHRLFSAMQEHPLSPGSIPIKLVLLALICLQIGCDAQRVRVEPSLTLTTLPPYGEGTAYKIAPIEGRVTGAQAGEKIVLYAKSTVWWIQPTVLEPFTSIQANGVWKNETHPGTSYAALLVRDGYHARPKLDQLPAKNNEVLAVAIADGPKSLEREGKMMIFAGYEWRIHETPNSPANSRNDYDAANSWTDRNGFLHLRIAGKPGHFTSSEVDLRRSLGYGSYRIVVRGLSELEPAAVFTMLTFADGIPSREMDIEISKWGEINTKNGQFVIQPYYVPANTFRFQVPGQTVTFMLRWAPDRAAFRTYRGAVTRWEATPSGEHVFTSGIPSPGNESLRLSLYVFGNDMNPLQHGNEVVVESFEYLP